MNQQNRNKLTDMENERTTAQLEGVRRPGGKGEGTEKYELVVTKQSRFVKCSLGNTVNNTAILCQMGTRLIRVIIFKSSKCLITML